MIGFTEFALAEVTPSAERLDRLLQLTSSIPHLEIEQALGLQSKQLDKPTLNSR